MTHSSELQLHAALTTPKALHSIYWLSFPVNSNSTVGSSCPSSPASCLWIPAHFTFLHMQIDLIFVCLTRCSYCLFEPCSCKCVTYRIVCECPSACQHHLGSFRNSRTFWRAAVPWPDCSFWGITTVVCGAERVTAGLWCFLPWWHLSVKEEGSRIWQRMGWAGRGTCIGWCPGGQQRAQLIVWKEPKWQELRIQGFSQLRGASFQCHNAQELLGLPSAFLKAQLEGR